MFPSFGELNNSTQDVAHVHVNPINDRVPEHAEAVNRYLEPEKILSRSTFDPTCPPTFHSSFQLKNHWTMEELREKHRHEKRDLDSRIVRKKKSATKKTRKDVNDECADLERQLKEQQDQELSRLDKILLVDSASPGSSLEQHNDPAPVNLISDVENSFDSLSISSTINKTDQTKKPNRQKARLARRAAEKEALIRQAAQEVEDKPNLRDQEREAMCKEFALRNLIETEIRSDGHCLYAAIADQLENSGIGLKPFAELPNFQYEAHALNPGYRIVRQVAASFVFHNSDDFLPFLEEPLEVYINRIRDTGEWGGHLELAALAKAYRVDINVLQSNGKVERIESCSSKSDHQLWLSYYHHSFGLGEHYNSLRRLK